MRRFDTLIQALNENRGEAVIASIAVTGEPARRVDFSDPLLPGAGALCGTAAQARDRRTSCRNRLEGKKVGVVGGTRALRPISTTLFTEAQPVRLSHAPMPRAMRCAAGEVDYVFGDGIALSFWINGTDLENCCAFAGGPFFESRYFGEGVGIAVPQGQRDHPPGAELGAVSAVGEGALRRSVAALFPGESVLTPHSGKN